MIIIRGFEIHILNLMQIPPKKIFRTDFGEQIRQIKKKNVIMLWILRICLCPFVLLIPHRWTAAHNAKCMDPSAKVVWTGPRQQKCLFVTTFCQEIVRCAGVMSWKTPSSYGTPIEARRGLPNSQTRETKLAPARKCKCGSFYCRAHVYEIIKAP